MNEQGIPAFSKRLFLSLLLLVKVSLSWLKGGNSAEEEVAVFIVADCLWLNMAKTEGDDWPIWAVDRELYKTVPSLSHYQLKQQTKLDNSQLWTILKYCVKCYFASVLLVSLLHTILGGIGNRDQIVIDLFEGSTVQWDCISIVM